jgi:hypothetical protein
VRLSVGRSGADGTGASNPKSSSDHCPPLLRDRKSHHAERSVAGLHDSWRRGREAPRIRRATRSKSRWPSMRLRCTHRDSRPAFRARQSVRRSDPGPVRSCLRRPAISPQSTLRPQRRKKQDTAPEDDAGVAGREIVGRDHLIDVTARRAQHEDAGADDRREAEIEASKCGVKFPSTNSTIVRIMAFFKVTVGAPQTPSNRRSDSPRPLVSANKRTPETSARTGMLLAQLSAQPIAISNVQFPQLPEPQQQRLRLGRIIPIAYKLRDERALACNMCLAHRHVPF